MTFNRRATLSALLLLGPMPLSFAQTVPPQDQGLPYTCSARPMALRKIQNHLAVFAGSRFAYLQGKRVRLDQKNPLGGEAILQGGKVWVPASFVGALSKKLPAFAPPPAALGPQIAARWVYDFTPPKAKIPAETTAKIDGREWVDFAAAAQKMGWQVSQPTPGLVLVGASPLSFASSEKALLESVVTLFDTPEKLADPDIATRAVPRLARQGKWTDHVKVTPEQLKLLDGPETVWPQVAREKFDLTGFNGALLGSKVPPPGVYPRLLFSPQDLPMIRARVGSQKLAQKSLIETEVLLNKSFWNPQTDDGKVFLKLASPTEYKTLKWPADGSHSTFEGQKTTVQTSHVNYNTLGLVAMAQWCLVKGDDVRGKQVATALANYYRLLEPSLDEMLALSDTESAEASGGNSSETSWRGIHALVAHMDLAWALDFGGTWMDAEQKAFMENFIAKATYGRRAYGQDGPLRTRDINWMTWDMAQFLAATAIEGTVGCDPEVLEQGRQSARAFLDFGVDSNGQIFESNGKSGGGIQFQILALIALARRGDNLWGHPHWRKLLAAQAKVTSPNGQMAYSSGTYSGGLLSPKAVNKILAFYPNDKAGAYLMTQIQPDFNAATFDLAAYRAQIEKNAGRTRFPSVSYPEFTYNVFYDTDWQPTTRAGAGLPLSFETNDYGLMSAYSDNTPEAAWLVLHARDKSYMGSGHHHADIGTFWFSSGGVNWLHKATDPFLGNTYDGKYHNQVLIDGIAEADGPPARGKYLGASTGPLGAFASVDQTKPYSYRWMSQVIEWNEVSGGSPWSASGRGNWELETDPLPIAVYKGTQHYKMRPWWNTYLFSNWIPVVRSPWNPVRYAFRSAGLVRGAQPYGVIVDDLKKDDASHLYQWSALTENGVVALPQNGSPDVILARQSDVKDGLAQAGAPLLLVRVFDENGPVSAQWETGVQGVNDRMGKPVLYNRITAGGAAHEAHFKTLLIPLKAGQAAPTTTYNALGNRLAVNWGAQNDEISLRAGVDGRSRFVVRRDGKTISEVQ